jgi:osmotically-inducible protein OsmY
MEIKSDLFEPLSSYLSDAEITAAIKTKLALTHISEAIKISVTTNDGAVFLVAAGLNEEEQKQVKNLVKNTEGVKQIFTSWEQDDILD